MLLGLWMTCRARGVAEEGTRHAPWVTCGKDGSTVRTLPIRSADGRWKAYAEIRAEGTEASCRNTVRLYVSGAKWGYREVFEQKPSEAEGTANSLGPVAWSADGCWLLVEFGNWWYESDAGGLGVLLYDRVLEKVTVVNLGEVFERMLRRDCSIAVLAVRGFDRFSRVRLRVTDAADEGDVGPVTHCFRGQEEWAMEPGLRWAGRVGGVSR